LYRRPQIRDSRAQIAEVEIRGMDLDVLTILSIQRDTLNDFSTFQTRLPYICSCQRISWVHARDTIVPTSRVICGLPPSA
jgi:hypothetical protein